MTEKRKFKRIPVDLELKYTKIIDDLSGKIKNICEQGLMFTAEEKLEKDSFLLINFKIKNKKFNTYAKVVWAKEIEKNKFDAGIKFIDIECSSFCEDLKEIISSLGV